MLESSTAGKVYIHATCADTVRVHVDGEPPHTKSCSFPQLEKQSQAMEMEQLHCDPFLCTFFHFIAITEAVFTGNWPFSVQLLYGHPNPNYDCIKLYARADQISLARQLASQI